MQSMTGFATVEGASAARRWRWEAKSVNGRGLDLRFRIGDGLDQLEPDLRALAGKALSRGNVTFALRTDVEAEEGDLVLNRTALATAIDAARVGEEMAADAGLHLSPAGIADLLALRGVLEPGGPAAPEKDLPKAVKDSFMDLLAALSASRGGEGQRIGATFTRLVDEIEALTGRAEKAFEAQQAAAPVTLSARVEALTGAGAEVEPDRLAQELALLAVKADIREEIDRIIVHVAAARDLIASDGPVGRKLDFLTQEFNREVNTLCSKSASAELTAIGLELKVVIDQMREQAQNIE
ncbi:MAG: YicC/YloC family endoribonuclease [Pseudomonadota bacterium]